MVKIKIVMTNNFKFLPNVHGCFVCLVYAFLNLTKKLI